MADRLKGKVALVLGAGCIEEAWGNGNATAVTFAREGAAVVSVDINLAAAERTASMVKKEGGRAIALQADIAKLADLERVVAKSLEAYGRIDILHNNVGINATGGPVEHTEEDWRKVLDVNVTGAFLAAKAVIPVMERQGGGSIINISSIAAIRWTGHPFIAYHASKAALNHMSTAIAAQYAPQKIRCNVIMPGLMDTPRLLHHIVNFYGGDAALMKKTRASSVPMKEMGTPWDIANAALFLASDESRYITGVCLPVDGGITVSTPHGMDKA